MNKDDKAQGIDDVRQRYDQLAGAPGSPFAEHIHHGYWVGTDDLLAAQTKLIEKLAHFAQIPRGAHILDVGCGTGGSASWLAQNLSCSVLGMSISEKEIALARSKARTSESKALLEFRVGDANKMDFPEASFEAVWILETSEHLSDKRRFLGDCARVLKSGGRLALGTCLAPTHPTAQQTERLAEVSRVLLTEPLGALPDYVAWTRANGFDQIETEEITDEVAPTWGHLLERMREERENSLGDKLARRQIIKLLTTMKAAYAARAIDYALLSASRNNSKPAPDEGALI